MKKPTTNPALAAIAAEAERVGWPTAFRRDLTVHDRNWILERDPKAPFMWALRECGTHSWDVKLRQERTNAVNFIASIAECHPEAKFYLWDGVGLQPFTSAAHAQAALEAFLNPQTEIEP